MRKTPFFVVSESLEHRIVRVEEVDEYLTSLHKVV